MAKGPGGRPSKLTEETKKALLQGIETGLTYELACNWAQISYRAFRYWVVKGEAASSGEYFQFVQELKEAEARGATAMLATIRGAANEGHWQAAAWILERRHREDYGRVVSAEITGKDGGPVRSEVNDTTPADKKAAGFAELFATLDELRDQSHAADGGEDSGEPLHPGDAEPGTA